MSEESGNCVWKWPWVSSRPSIDRPRLRRGPICDPNRADRPIPWQHGPMFERTAQYEAAYVGEFPAFEEHAGPALRWALDMARQLRSPITVVAPTRRHFRDIGILNRLPPTAQQATPQTLGHFPQTHPVVLCFWPTAKVLDQLDRAHDLRTLVVVPWLEEDVATWRQARGALDLLGRHPVPESPKIADPVVEAAMRSLTRMVNLSTGVGHPRDRSMAIHAFRILTRNGHAYEPDEIRAWAMANGWTADDARELSEYAAGVLEGKAYRAGQSIWKQQIIRRWRKDAAED